MNCGKPTKLRPTTLATMPRGSTTCRAAATNSSVATPRLQQLMQTIKEDSKKMFTDEGIDISVYAEDVEFRDPMNKFDSAKVCNTLYTYTIQGFANNLKFLKNVFNPSYDILEMRAVNDTDFEARWSMGFELQLARKTPLRKYWQPKLAFTGTTYYGTNAETGLIDQHLDEWDNVSNNKYFSFEAFGDILRQLGNLQRTPDLKGPEFILLKRKRDYSIRQYEPFVVAETSTSGSPEHRRQAFRTLAQYLFGGNQSEQKMAMTTPVISNSEAMQFVLPVSTVDEAPKPRGASSQDTADGRQNASVKVQQVDGDAFAVCGFSGRADADAVAQHTEKLLEVMRRDGLHPKEHSAGRPCSLLLQYNDPGVKPLFRTNEVMVPIASGFDLWKT